MPLFKIHIFNQDQHDSVVIWKEKGSAKAALEYAKLQANEIYDGTEASCRYIIEEEKPAA
jgi:hypothetical protein